LTIEVEGEQALMVWLRKLALRPALPTTAYGVLPASVAV